MRSSYARRALARAVDSARFTWNSPCEALEQRRLLASGDPVIVLTETFAPSEIDVAARYLWHNPSEGSWDLHAWNAPTSPWSQTDGNDANSLADDFYGWNFGNGNGSPNIIASPAVHGTAVLDQAVAGIQDAAGVDADLPNHVKIMFVIGSGDQMVNYIVDKKVHDGVNIIGISNSVVNGGLTAANAATLNENGILFFCPGGNGDIDRDRDLVRDVGDALEAFDRATPRLAVQRAPLENVITATTDPGWGSTNYGVNSFYFATPGVAEQSYAVSRADAYAGVAVAAYQVAHAGVTPDWQDVKRAMMSGVDYTDDLVASGQRLSDTLAGRTITHNWDGQSRTSGGVLNLGKIVASINQATPEVRDVSMTVASPLPLGTDVTFDLNRNLSAERPSNWTINWGDDTDSDVLPGTFLSETHLYPFSNEPHEFFPTIYAMSDSKQVYVAASTAQAEVDIPGVLPGTNAADSYVLSVSGASGVLTLNGTSSFTFSPDDLPRLYLALGNGDMLRINLSGADALAGMSIAVVGTAAAGNRVSVIGSSGDDSIDAEDRAVTVGTGTNTGTIAVYADVPLFIDGGDGNDTVVSHLTTQTSDPVTVVGGPGDDDITDGVGGTRIDYTADPEPISATGDGTLATVHDGYGGTDTLHHFSTLVGSSGNDTLDVDCPNLFGGDGNDTLTDSAPFGILHGGAGDDLLQGGDANQVLSGDDGNDTLDGGTGPDSLDGGAGTDTITYGSRINNLTITLDGSFNDGESGGGEGDNVMPNVEAVVGGSGDDTISATGVTSSHVTLSGGAGNDTIDGGGGADVLDGGDGNDVVRGNGGNDIALTGGTGNDSLDGGAGDDALFGNDGNDTLVGGAGTGTEALFGNAGDDVIRLAAGTYTVDGGTGVDTLDGTAPASLIVYCLGGSYAGTAASIAAVAYIESVSGSAGNDLIDVSLMTAAVTVHGNNGADTITGSSNPDSLFGDAGNDSISGAAGGDTLDGGDGNDSLSGGDGDDSMIGGTGSDYLIGDTGDDAMYGGTNNDTFSAGDGGHDFVDGGSGTDQVLNYDDGVDQIVNVEIIPAPPP